MYQSLINKYNGEVVQILKGGSDVRFEVHEDFIWAAGPYEIDENLGAIDYHYDSGVGQVKLKELPEPPYDLGRRVGFGGIEEQLDMLWHDIDEGRIPGKETSLWYAHLKDVKENNPKP